LESPVTEREERSMSAPFIYLNTTGVKQGQLEGWLKYFAEFAEFIEANEPRLLHFGTYVNEEGTEQTIVQVHPDPESMAFHMGLLAEHASAAGDYLDFSTARSQVYGEPDPAVLEQIRGFAPHIPVTVGTPGGGFARFLTG
jgi:hypothetical protein